MKMIELSNSNFKTFIKENYYYVDKSLLIEELINEGSQILLLPRPRRFGKTLNLSMLKYYFDIRKDSKDLFKGLNIEKSNLYEKHLNRYPVVFLTFKDVKGLNWEEDHIKLITEITREYREHKYLLNSDKLDERDKNYINKVLDQSNIDYSNSILELSRLLYEHYNQKVIILLDEYDTPVNKMVDNDHYKYLMSFIRNMIGSTFKGNDYLYKGVITGILKIAKESIFSGANNILVRTILDNDFSDKFGFTEEEVIEALKYFNLEDKLKDVRAWYNGYTFGNNVIYNPFSIISFLKSSEKKLDGYWSNSGDPSLIRALLINAESEVKEKIEELLKGNEIKAEIEVNFVFNELNDTRYLWSLLLFSGYLKCTHIDGKIYTLEIPNKEIKECYSSIMRTFFNKIVKDPLKIIDAIKERNIESFKKELNWLIISILSNHDVINENSYHMFIIGLLAYLYNDYDINSNRESGYGRYDISIIPKDKNKAGYIIEIKLAKNKKDIKRVAEEAINQIKNNKYITELLKKQISDIIVLGIAFKGKDIYILSENLNESVHTKKKG